MQDGLSERLTGLAAAPDLIIGCDYDGTLAEIVPNPALAFPNPSALHAFRSLGGLTSTTTAIVSGRSFAALAAFVGTQGPELLVGSHGAEWRAPGVPLSDERRRLLIDVAGAVDRIATQNSGLRTEVKPAGVALHVRTVERRIAEAAVAAVVAQCADWSGVHVRHGSEVVEVMVVPANKATAVRRVRSQFGSVPVIFIGDDLTDEDVFRSLSGDDLGIKVGPGETAARFRVTGVAGVAAVLETLASQRRACTRREQPQLLSRSRGVRPSTPDGQSSQVSEAS